MSAEKGYEYVVVQSGIPAGLRWTAVVPCCKEDGSWHLSHVWGPEEKGARFQDESDAIMVARSVEKTSEASAVVEKVQKISELDAAALVVGAYAASARAVRNSAEALADAYAGTSPAMTEMGKIRIEALLEVATTIDKFAASDTSAAVVTATREREALRAISTAAQKARNDYAAAIEVGTSEGLIDGEELDESRAALSDLDKALARLARIDAGER